MKKTIAAGALGGIAAFIGISFLVAASTAWGDFIAIPRGTGSGLTGRVRWRELTANGTHSVDLKAPDSLPTTVSLTLPNALPGGTDYSLVGNSSGVTSWKDITGGGGGGGVLLEQHTASASASLDFTSCISSTYDDYLVSLVDIVIQNDGQALLWRWSTDDGATYDAGNNYQWFGYFVAGAGLSGGLGAQTLVSGIQIAPLVGNDTGQHVSGWVRFSGPASSLTKYLSADVVQHLTSDSRNYRSMVGGTYITTAVTDFRIIPLSGSITSGTARCYAMAK